MMSQMKTRSIKVTTVLNEEQQWATSMMAEGYGTDMTKVMNDQVEDLIRAILTAASGNQVEVFVNGIKVEIGGSQTPDWLKNIVG